MANEKRLIDVEQAKSATYQQIYWSESDQSAVRNFIVKLPRVDAVEVVRCKDCKHYDGERCEHDRHAHQEFAVWAYDDDFCSYGERREGE